MSSMFQRKSLVTLALSGALALCFMFAIAAPTFAAGGQRGMLSGRLVDAHNTGIAGADVTLSAPTGRFTAHTNRKGTFSILGVNVDSYVLTIKKDGFAKVSQPGIDVTGDQTTDLGTITLQKS